MVSRPAHAAFHHVTDTQLLRDFFEIARDVALVLLYRSAADYFQILNLREVRQQLILDSICKKSVLLFIAEIFQRQHRNAFLRNRLAGLPVKRASPNDQHCNNQQQHPDNDEVEDLSGGTLNRSRLCRIEIFRPHYSFGGQFVEPGEQHRDWKSDRERNDNKTHCGIGNFKKREDLRRELSEEPCDDSVSDCCAVNVAPRELGQKVLGVHSARLDEALVLTAFYLDARDLKSAWSIQN